jgi:hypothetical protein
MSYLILLALSLWMRGTPQPLNALHQQLKPSASISAPCVHQPAVKVGQSKSGLAVA